MRVKKAGARLLVLRSQRDGDAVHVLRGADVVTLVLDGYDHTYDVFLEAAEWALVLESVRILSDGAWRMSAEPPRLVWVDGTKTLAVEYTNWGDPFEQGLRFHLSGPNYQTLADVSLESSVLAELLP